MKINSAIQFCKKAVKIILLPKTLRIICLALVLLASLLCLLQDNFNQPRLIVLGRVAWDQSENVAVVNSYITWPRSKATSLEIPDNRVVLSQFNHYPNDTEFLMVLRRSGDKLSFDRIYALEQPDNSALEGPRWEVEPRLDIVVGTSPKLVEMIGLDRYIYRLRQPLWAREQLVNIDRVEYQDGKPRPLKWILDDETNMFHPNVWLLDAGGRVTHVRRIGDSLLTWPGLVRKLALWGFGLAAAVALLAVILHFWPHLAKAARAAARRLHRPGRTKTAEGK